MPNASLRRALSLAALLLGASAPAAAQQPVREARASRDSLVVAILPLAVPARDTLLEPLAFGLADLLATDLARSGQLTLVERARFAEVLRELSLTSTGVVDSATAPRTGRLLQARTLVTGGLRRVGPNELGVDARLVDVGTSRIDGGLDARAPLSDVLAAEKALAFRLFDVLGVVLTPRERTLVEQRPTRSLAALVAYGQGVRGEVNGQYGAALRGYRRAVAADPSFQLAAQRLDGITSRLRGVGALAASALNRPLETVPVAPRPGLVADPSFPGGTASVTITFTRP